MVNFIMMVGLAGSGKSTYVQKNYNKDTDVIISSDAVREEIYGSADVQENPQKVFRIMQERVRESLKQGKNVWYDATNLNAKRRAGFIKEIKSWHIPDIVFTCLVLLTPLDKCIWRQNNRERKVPAYAITKQYLSFEVPYWNEGWHSIELMYEEGVFTYPSLMERIAETVDFDQENSHHTLSLYEHLMKAYELAKQDLSESVDPIPLDAQAIEVAAFLHDIGKYTTKTHGDDGQAHYYGHEHASTYDFLCSREVAWAWEIGPNSNSMSAQEALMRSMYRGSWKNWAAADISMFRGHS